jgi:hypothetical protein
MSYGHASFGGGERLRKAAGAALAFWTMKIERHDKPVFTIRQAVDVPLLRWRV